MQSVLEDFHPYLAVALEFSTYPSYIRLANFPYPFPRRRVQLEPVDLSPGAMAKEGEEEEDWDYYDPDVELSDFWKEILGGNNGGEASGAAAAAVVQGDPDPVKAWLRMFKVRRRDFAPMPNGTIFFARVGIWSGSVRSFDDRLSLFLSFFEVPFVMLNLQLPFTYLIRMPPTAATPIARPTSSASTGGWRCPVCWPLSPGGPRSSSALTRRGRRGRCCGRWRRSSRGGRTGWRRQWPGKGKNISVLKGETNLFLLLSPPGFLSKTPLRPSVGRRSA